MAKKKSPVLKILGFVFCLLLGAACSFVALAWVSLPDSYEIPQSTTGSTPNPSNGQLDVETIKGQDLSIHFLELGNKYTGDCTFIKSGNTEMLIDAGSRESSVPVISNYINQYCTDGILEYVVVTHAHQDHYAGFATSSGKDSIFDIYKVNLIIEFAKTNKADTATMQANYIREKGEAKDSAGNQTKVVTALDCVNGTNEAQRTYDLSSNVNFTILYHEFYEQEASSENDYSVCLIVNQTTSAGDKHYLFTGDLEKDGEESLVSSSKNEGYLYEVEVYKAGHHGSKTSSSEALLKKVKPKKVCVCCCAGSSEYTSKNENQFPTQIFINRIAEFAETDQVFVTSLCIDYKNAQFTSMNGNIVISCSFATATTYVNCSNNNTILKETDWFKNNRTVPPQWQ
ncbi:MAG: MBL fold metallo-hydrolase [Clostridia bacterium]|nr:MBL fold metallo-hydrolase [Clostridia bacterium]